MKLKDKEYFKKYYEYKSSFLERNIYLTDNIYCQVSISLGLPRSLSAHMSLRFYLFYSN